jgi:CubicO group peptidase (beta-lactamase class C family)
MRALGEQLDQLAGDTGFSGVVRVDDGEQRVVAAYGLARRDLGIANTTDTQFGIASGVKGLTALTIVSLIEDGTISLSTTARSVLGDDLPLIDDRVSVEHLLAHRSGIGDYLDEDAGHDIDGYVMPVSVHLLADTEQYLAALDGHPTKFAPGEQFAYCNGGYVVLALIAERTTGVAFHDLVRQRVCEPAGMTDTAFLRSDELPGRAALGYLTLEDVSRTNVFHLPVRGSGDGGIYTTVDDVHHLWSALFAGRIVAADAVAMMVRPRSDVPAESMRYGLGFWLHETSDVVMLEGYDAGVSFRSAHDPAAQVTYTVIANTSEGAWPLVRLLRGALTEPRKS